MKTDIDLATAEVMNKSDYKKTKVGLIPKDWHVELLDNISRRCTGHTPDKKRPEYYDGGIKWVSLADSNKLDKGTIRKTSIEISEQGLANSSAVLLPKGTVVMSRDAGVGKSAIIDTEMAVSQHFVAWVCGQKLLNWFLYYYLQRQKSFQNVL